MVKVSVLLPTYNYARFLPAAIESVLAQDHDNFELLISDDASQDDSAEIIRAYAAEHPRIRFQLHPRNLGMVANWNWCLREAAGAYVKFLFGDDLLAEPGALRKLAGLLDAHPGAVLATSARHVIDETDAIIAHWDFLGDAELQSGREVGRRCLLQTENLVGEPTAVMFRAAAAQRGFDPHYRQIVDLEMWCHLLRRGDLAYTREPLCAFRHHETQQSEANRGHNVGRREYLALLRTHRPHFLPVGTQFETGERRYLFRAIYDARKHGDDPSEIELAQTFLLPALGRGWYAAHWLRHRLTRPFENLGHAWHRHILEPWRKRTAASHPSEEGVRSSRPPFLSFAQACRSGQAKSFRPTAKSLPTP